MRWVEGLRFPWLFLLAALLFGVNVMIPDVIPFVDELLLGLVTLLLGRWRDRRKSGQDCDTDTNS